MKQCFSFIFFCLSLSVALTACDPGRHERMERELLRARAMNKEYVPFTTDSVMLKVAGWFDRHGTPNERMEAHYLLGCAYRDMGEAPRAINAFQDAASEADTTATDCDFYTLACIYSQMAWLYGKLLLLSFEIEAHRKASHYHFLSKDTLRGLFEQKMVACTYILQNKRDSAELVIRSVMQKYHETGNVQEELTASQILIYILVEQSSNQTETKQLIDRYDEQSGSFDSHHELNSPKRLFYYYKGKYFECVNMLDSAEYYYRKVYRPGMSFVDYDPMYRGLLSIFGKRHNADSIAKYAQLYCAVNDSSIAIKDQELTAQLAASYNYSRHRQVAQENERKAHKAELLLISLGIVLCVVLASAVCIARLYRLRQRKRRKLLEDEHRRKECQLREAYRQELSRQEHLFQQKEAELQRMEDVYRKVTETIRLELDNAKSENLNMREDYARARRSAEEISRHYEKDKTALNKEIEALKTNIEELKMRNTFTEYKDASGRIHATGIVKKLKSSAGQPNEVMATEETEELSATFRHFFPIFVQDMKMGKGLNDTDELIAMLTALGLKPGHIQCLTGKSSSQITNSKAKTNRILFADNSASSLYQNMVSRYGI